MPKTAQTLAATTLMDIELEPGKYVVAVSGGVDSVVLLDLLEQKPGLDLIVAHFDHGIRSDSASDRTFVGELARKHGLQFEFAEGRLGPNVSEDMARRARYDFLQKVKNTRQARAIITAHHQDDLLETAIINLMRGTGRRGLTALKSTDIIKRPLLRFSKNDIKNYASKHKLAWREDSTNADNKYLRNRVRHDILPRLDRQKLLAIVEAASRQNREIDNLLDEIVTTSLNRQNFIVLDHKTSLEIMAAWLRSHGIMNYDKKTLERLVIAGKTARFGSRHSIIGTRQLLINKTGLELVTA